eukprot:CAMPEP_0170457166 /NCGR_PEP_ID=MMETSP0123-20130129/4548_1 /TAXON_ID=182087 /ORGANISM="Favella ehrenbergii, Strain Fehren 1" /LENGTH=125 /DNA_ID=CAMNT_0010720867 /DNA_START=1038 /DNA_END=1415 /DNA_ORIENTATION=+
MREDLVVDKWREAITTESESDVATRGCIQETSLARVDTLQQLHWLTLLLEVNQIFIVLEDFDIGEGTPGVLNFLSSDDVFRLLGDLLSALLVASPEDLDGCDVIHGESMVLEKATSEGHLVGCLD